ncbi:MAG: glycosyltransferase family 2 protein [Deltaproteobacteria bacterium]|nr:glycosyltransferase family 2 protein [Deltaproteobacteria bacterium]
MMSVTILTKNSERLLNQCLKALQNFDEVVILDNGSTDNTLKIAFTYPNIKLIQSPFTGFGHLKNLAAKKAKNDWIFNIDSDEIVSPELFQEIKNLKKESPTLIFRLRRKNHFNGKWLQGCGWYPDKVLRLYNKKTHSFNENLVHESIVPSEISKIIDLKNPILHYPFNSSVELITKMQQYSSLYAEQNKHKKRSTPFKAFIRAFFSFIKSYFIQRGLLDGYEGLIISFYNASCVFFKYIKLFEENKK